jgi:glycosyltransferase involved in cell wall biosynthesis
MSVTRRVTLVTLDGVGARLAGSAIRALELGRALSQAGHKPTVVAPMVDPDADAYPFPIRAFDLSDARGTLLPLLADAEMIVLPLHALVRMPALNTVRTPLVFDIYDPFVFELLASGTERPPNHRQREVRAHCSVINHALHRGDFFICATERQRDMWIGALAANGRLVPASDGDPSFRHLIDVVPLGIPDEPPVHADGDLPASISPSGTVIVSSGVIWDWQDPLTAISAIAQIAQRRTDIHLVLFAGPHPTVGQTSAADAARAMAAERGVLDRQVHFLNEWVPYAERGRYLCACDAGITTHRSSLESHFSFRTRVLDYLWAGLPVVCTEGDILAEFVAQHQLGIVVREGDVGALAAAFERIADDKVFVESCRTHIAAVRASLTWRVAAEPLVRYCEAPRFGDRSARGIAATRELAVSAWRVLRKEGLRRAVERVHRHAFLRG